MIISLKLIKWNLLRRIDCSSLIHSTHSVIVGLVEITHLSLASCSSSGLKCVKFSFYSLLISFSRVGSLVISRVVLDHEKNEAKSSSTQILCRKFFPPLFTSTKIEISQKKVNEIHSKSEEKKIISFSINQRFRVFRMPEFSFIYKIRKKIDFWSRNIKNSNLSSQLFIKCLHFSLILLQSSQSAVAATGGEWSDFIISSSSEQGKRKIVGRNFFKIEKINAALALDLHTQHWEERAPKINAKMPRDFLMISKKDFFAHSSCFVFFHHQCAFNFSWFHCDFTSFSSQLSVEKFENKQKEDVRLNNINLLAYAI